MNYEKLSLQEKKIVESIVTKNVLLVEQKLALINRKAKNLTETSDKIYVAECVNKIKGDIKVDFKESVFKVFELENTVLNLIEAKGSESTIKLPNLKYIKNIKILTLGDDSAPGTIFIQFNVSFYPQSKTQSELNDELQSIKKTFVSMGRNILNQTIVWNKSKYPAFKGTGIWEGDVAIMLAKLGKVINARGEWALDIDQSSSRSLSSLREPVLTLLQDVETLLEKWYPIDVLVQRNSNTQVA